MTKSLLSFALMLAAAVGTIPKAFGFDHGDGGGNPSQQRSIVLTPTAAGARHNASGTASWKINGNDQKFKVDFDIHVPNGTLYLINVDGTVVGSVTVFLNEAEFEVESDDGRPLPPPLNPVTQIQQVSVTNNAGVVVLQGSF